jgi:type IX secretion system PorP/SprF family membrane protein
MLICPSALYGQQFPFMEGYNLNPFTLSPAYAGIYNGKTLFMDYRTDMAGLEGGPSTCQLSYSQKFSERLGLGARFIYDRTDIFRHTLLLGTYSYQVKLANEHSLNFGLSLGFYRNSIDLAKYYNDPGYVQDQVLVYGQERSKMLFATDISALYRYKKVEAGILFSNVMFGTARYHNTDLKYKPLKNYLVHASYLFQIDEKWEAKTTFIIRGGQDIPVQIEFSPTITWDKHFWGTVRARTGGFLGVGLGGEIYKGILLNYSYDTIITATHYTFASHQITLGVRIFDIIGKDKTI